MAILIRIPWIQWCIHVSDLTLRGSMPNSHKSSKRALGVETKCIVTDRITLNYFTNYKYHNLFK